MLSSLLARYQEAQKSGCLYIVSGPSGAGKTTLCRQAANTLPRLLYSISYTTRPQRPQEVDGRDYFFLSEPEFKNKIESGDFLEWAKVHNHYYGTCRHWITNQLAQHNDVILDIDVQGAAQLRQLQVPSCSIFVVPPSEEILEKRLVERKSDAINDITQRLQTAQEEIQQAVSYQYLIINDTIAEALEDLTSIIQAHRCLLNTP